MLRALSDVPHSGPKVKLNTARSVSIKKELQKYEDSARLVVHIYASVEDHESECHTMSVTMFLLSNCCSRHFFRALLVLEEFGRQQRMEGNGFAMSSRHLNTYAWGSMIVGPLRNLAVFSFHVIGSGQEL